MSAAADAVVRSGSADRRRGATDLAPVAAAVTVVVGARVGEAAGPAGAEWALGLGLAGVFAAAAGAGRGWERGALALVLAALALLGGAAMQRALDGLARSPLGEAASRATPVQLRGEAVGDARGSRFRVELPVRVVAWHDGDGQWRGGGGRHVLVRTGAADASRLRPVVAGDRVVVEGLLTGLPDGRTHWRWRHVGVALEGARVLDWAPADHPVHRVANAVRDRVLAGGRRLPVDQRALLSGFLLGDTRALTPAVEQDFRDAGLTHLLAVSGSNVAFVLVVAGPLVRRLPRGARLAVVLAVLVVFAVVTRWEPSVLRATVMAACSAGAVALGRPGEPLRLLAYAVVVLVLVDPFLVHSIAFALSCGASLGIVLGAAPLAGRLPGPRLVREPLAVTFAAQAGVTPVLLGVFGSMPAVTPLTNLVAVPVAEPLTVYGLTVVPIAGLVAPVLPALASLAALPAAAMTAWVRTVAAVGAAVPLHLDAGGCAGLVALGAGWAAVRRARGTLAAGRGARSGPGGGREGRG